MTLAEQITDAQSYIADPPENESNTCERIIRPLLVAAGYENRDIDSRIADNGGNFPDYTLLKNTSATWYLEAKAWNVTLRSNHVQQALNYANHNGKRFVVLTNGQTWELYDNAIQGVLDEKFVTRASIRNEEAFTEFMKAISKEVVCSGGLERYVEELAERKRREAIERQEKERQAEILSLLQTTVSEQLCDAESEIIEFITLYLSEKEGYQGIKAETVAEWFKEVLSPVPSSEPEPIKISTTQNPFPASTSTQKATKTLDLLEIQGHDMRFKKPTLLCFPDNTQSETRSWPDLVGKLIHWLIQKSYSLPIPFPDTTTRLFLNTVPRHKSGKSFHKPGDVEYKGNTVYWDKNQCNQDFLKDIYALCLAVNVAPEGFRITFA